MEDSLVLDSHHVPRLHLQSDVVLGIVHNVIEGSHCLLYGYEWKVQKNISIITFLYNSYTMSMSQFKCESLAKCDQLTLIYPGGVIMSR